MGSTTVDTLFLDGWYVCFAHIFDFNELKTHWSMDIFVEEKNNTSVSL